MVSTVPAISTVGPVLGVEPVLGDGIEGSTHAPSAKATINPRMKVFFIGPSFGLRLTDDLHELGHNIAQHTFRQRTDLAMDDFAV